MNKRATALKGKSTPKGSPKQVKKPAYSFLGMSGGGLNKPKKEIPNFPKMKRDEFVKEKKFSFVKEGDDYYYSLKENQF